MQPLKYADKAAFDAIFDNSLAHFRTRNHENLEIAPAANPNRFTVSTARGHWYDGIRNFFSALGKFFHFYSRTRTEDKVAKLIQILDANVEYADATRKPQYDALRDRITKLTPNLATEIARYSTNLGEAIAAAPVRAREAAVANAEAGVQGRVRAVEQRETAATLKARQLLAEETRVSTLVAETSARADALFAKRIEEASTEAARIKTLAQTTSQATVDEARRAGEDIVNKSRAEREGIIRQGNEAKRRILDEADENARRAREATQKLIADGEAAKKRGEDEGLAAKNRLTQEGMAEKAKLVKEGADLLAAELAKIRSLQAVEKTKQYDLIITCGDDSKEVPPGADAPLITFNACSCFFEFAAKVNAKNAEEKAAKIKAEAEAKEKARKEAEAKAKGANDPQGTAAKPAANVAAAKPPASPAVQKGAPRVANGAVIDDGISSPDQPAQPVANGAPKEKVSRGVWLDRLEDMAGLEKLPEGIIGRMNLDFWKGTFDVYLELLRINYFKTELEGITITMTDPLAQFKQLDELLELYRIANYFTDDATKEKIFNRIKALNLVTPGNVLDLVVDHEDFIVDPQDPFYQYAFQTIKDNFKEISNKPKFLELSLPFIKAILAIDGTNNNFIKIETERDLYIAIEKWSLAYIERENKKRAEMNAGLEAADQELQAKKAADVAAKLAAAAPQPAAAEAKPAEPQKDKKNRFELLVHAKFFREEISPLIRYELMPKDYFVTLQQTKKLYLDDSIALATLISMDTANAVKRPNRTSMICVEITQKSANTLRVKVPLSGGTNALNAPLVKDFEVLGFKWTLKIIDGATFLPNWNEGRLKKFQLTTDGEIDGIINKVQIEIVFNNGAPARMDDMLRANKTFTENGELNVANMKYICFDMIIGE